MDNTDGPVLSIVTEDEETLLEMFMRSELDLLVGPFDRQWARDNDLIVVPMVEDEIVAMVRTEHPILDLSQLSLDSLGAYPLVVPKTQTSGITGNLQEILKAVKIKSDNYDLLKKICKQSNAICAGPRAVFKDELEGNILQEVPISLSIKWRSTLLVRPETIATPLAKLMVEQFDLTAQAFKQLHD